MRTARRTVLGLEALDDRAVPAIITTADVYSVDAGRVLTVTADQGVLANDFSDANIGDVLVANQKGGIVAITDTGAILGAALPPNTIRLNPNGSFTLVAPANLPANVERLEFSYQATNLLNVNEAPGFGTVSILISGRSSGVYAVGADAGGAPQVNVYEAGTNALKFSFLAYEGGFTGGVRVAVGDMNQDGIDDIVTAPGVGGSARIRVFDGKTGGTIFDDSNIFSDPNFRGGAYVAVGDVDGNGTEDIIVGAGEGGAPRVTVIGFSPFAIGLNQPFTKLADFYAYESTFRNGVRVAAGDLQGNNRADIVTAPGQGGGPVVKAFDYQAVTGNVVPPVPFGPPVIASAVSPQPPARLSFYAGNLNERDGMNIGVGDFRGDGISDIITGAPAEFRSVQVFNGRTGEVYRQFTVPQDEVPAGGGAPSGPSTYQVNSQFQSSGSLLQPAQAPTSLASRASNASAFPGLALGGVRVGAVDYNGDGLDDIITGNGVGVFSRVRVFNTTNNTELTNYVAFPTTFLGGVFVNG